MSDGLPAPIDLIPHRPPFLLVDELTELVCVFADA